MGALVENFKKKVPFWKNFRSQTKLNLRLWPRPKAAD